MVRKKYRTRYALKTQGKRGSNQALDVKDADTEKPMERRVTQEEKARRADKAIDEI